METGYVYEDAQLPRCAFTRGNNSLLSSATHADQSSYPLAVALGFQILTRMHSGTYWVQNIGQVLT
jgi:hypothetical protein